jgi:hypothetical protein
MDLILIAEQQDQVVHFRLAAIRPVMNVVGVDEARGRAAGEAAAAVAAFECSSDRWWDAAGFAAYL